MRLREDIEAVRVDDYGSPIGIETLPAGTELVGRDNYPRCTQVDGKDVWRFHLCVKAGENTQHYVAFTRPVIVLSEDEIKNMAYNSLEGYPDLLAFFIHEKWEALIRETFGDPPEGCSGHSGDKRVDADSPLHHPCGDRDTGSP